jgi:hypothetical protein
MSQYQRLNDEGIDPSQKILKIIKDNWPFKIPTQFGRWPRKSFEKGAFIITVELSTYVDDTLDLGRNAIAFRSVIQVHILYKRSPLPIASWFEKFLTEQKIEHTPIQIVSSSPYQKKDTMIHLVNNVRY